MATVASLLVALVAVSHLWFLILEMFLWTKPVGMKVSRLSPEHAQITAVLAANQGLYNGFLSAGLVFGLIETGPLGYAFRVFFLGCVIIAGLYGAWSVSRRIFFIQALPAIVAMAVVLLSA